ncbi:hypothetical protein cand_033250 [Cryptosporidium andersoni]|uniref:Uncharacterized protein n=1 Tax=Cryptosporidium andersoni TaxID=117008 RepID=A0A1J4MF20_9CRYT|nr:hypothetical protein cand_033250 [Cryptosporidium andersoni]
MMKYNIWVLFTIAFVIPALSLEVDTYKNVFISSNGNVEVNNPKLSSINLVRSNQLDDQLKFWDSKDIHFSINSKDLIHLPASLRSGSSLDNSDRGSFVIYDTNDYPFACLCDKQEYENWKESGNSSTKVQCANYISNSIFNQQDLSYCDPTNIAASENLNYY